MGTPTRSLSGVTLLRGVLLLLAAMPTARGHVPAHGLVRGAGNGVLVCVLAETIADADGDTITDIIEELIGTDPFRPDTDGDGMEDGWELANGLDPLDFADAFVDLDGDGLDSLQEFELGTLTYEVDTDHDGFWDQIELARGTDAASGASFPRSSRLGDVDADGDVDATDVQFAINGLLGFPIPVPVNVNRVGDITVADLQMVINEAVLS